MEGLHQFIVLSGGALGRSNQGSFVPSCVSLCRWYLFPLCSASLCFQHLPFSPLCLWFWRTVPWPYVLMFSAKHNGTNMSVTAALHATVIHNCVDIYAVMSCAHWHAMQRIITSSLTATSHFPDDSCRTWEGVEFKVWQQNRMEAGSQDNRDLKEGSKPFISETSL